MKKILLSAMAAALCALGVSAQNVLLDDPANHSYVGLRAGLDISAPTPDVYKNGAGFHVGAIYNAKIIKNFYIEPGVSVYYDTWSINNRRLETNIGEELHSVHFKSSFRNLGLRIPLMFGYHFDFTPDVNVAIFTGPELNIGMRSRYHYDAHVDGMSALNVNGSVSCYSPGEPITGNESVDEVLDHVQNLFHRVDCAWNVGVGVNFSNFYVSAGGAIGMTNIYKRSNASAFSDDSFRMNRMTVSVGYNF